MAFPLMLRAIQIAMAQVDVGLEQAARTLGASRLETFWRVTLPLARRGVVAGALLAFTRGLGEFGATIMIAANIPGETQTMPLYIYSALGTPDGLKSSSGLVIASVLIAGGALWLERTGRNNSKRHGTQRNAPQAVRAGGELGSGQ
jgi:molybdate transport system permease protein